MFGHTRWTHAPISRTQLLDTKIYGELGKHVTVEVTVADVDGDGIPGVSIATRESHHLFHEPGWQFRWVHSPWIEHDEHDPTPAKNIALLGTQTQLRESLKRWGKYPTSDGGSRWNIPEELDEILLGVVRDRRSTVKRGGMTVYTNSAYPNRAPEPTVPHDGHLRLRELHDHELDSTDGGLLAQELRDLGLESKAFVAFTEDDDPGELSNVMMLEEFRLGSVIKRTRQTSIYSAKRIPPLTPEEEEETLEARAYVLDGIDPKLKKYRLRSIARVLSRTVASWWLWGQYVVFYTVDGSREVEGGDAAVAERSRLPLVKMKQKTEAQRKKARIKQRDRRRRAREKKGGDRELESEGGVSKTTTRIEGRILTLDDIPGPEPLREILRWALGKGVRDESESEDTENMLGGGDGEELSDEGDEGIVEFKRWGKEMSDEHEDRSEEGGEPPEENGEASEEAVVGSEALRELEVRDEGSDEGATSDTDDGGHLEQEESEQGFDGGSTYFPSAKILDSLGYIVYSEGGSTLDFNDGEYRQRIHLEQEEREQGSGGASTSDIDEEEISQAGHLEREVGEQGSDGGSTSDTDDGESEARDRENRPSSSPSLAETGVVEATRAKQLTVLAAQPRDRRPAGQKSSSGQAGARRAGSWARNAALHAIMWTIFWVAIVALIVTRPFVASSVLLVVAICVRVLARGKF